MIRVTHIIAGLAPDGAEKMLHRLVAGMDSTPVRERSDLTDESGTHGSKASSQRGARPSAGHEAG